MGLVTSVVATKVFLDFLYNVVGNIRPTYGYELLYAKPRDSSTTLKHHTKREINTILRPGS